MPRRPNLLRPRPGDRWAGLSILQPWASLVAIKEKVLETRTWGPAFRGWLAIHASKKRVEPVNRAPFVAALAAHGLELATLPVGAVVAVALLQGVYRAEAALRDLRSPNLLGSFPRFEEAFGDYSAGRYAWGLTNVHRLREPLPCRGALGLWPVPPDLEQRILERLP